MDSRSAPRADDAAGSWWARAGKRLASDRAAARPVSGLLLLAIVALPLSLLALSAWVSWRDAWHSAAQEVDQAAGAIAEYGARVLDAHAAAAARVDALLRGLSDTTIRAREAALHQEMKGLLAEIPKADTGFVTDRHGKLLVGASVFPLPDDAPRVADRDYFRALMAEPPPPLHLGTLYQGRLDRRSFFAVSRRRQGTGNEDVPPGTFDGVVNVPVDAARLGEALRRFRPTPDDLASLVRMDGVLLAQASGSAPSPPARALIHSAAAAGTWRTTETLQPGGEGAPHLVATRRIEGWPAYAVVGRTHADIVAAWRGQMITELAIGVPATLALLGLALTVRRTHRELAESHAGLETRVAERSMALAESEARLHLALEAVGISMSLIDLRRGTITRTGPASPGRSVVPPEELPLERFIEEAIHPEDAAATRAVVARISERGVERGCFTCRARRPDGSGWRWIEVHGAVVERDPETGASLRAICMTRDVSDRYAAAAALTDRERRLQQALVVGRVMAFDYSAADDMIRRSPTAATILGLPESVAECDPRERFRASVHPDDRARRDAVMRALSPASPAYVIRYRVLRPDGRVVWLEDQGLAEFGPDGRLARLTGLDRDITREIEAEEARRASEARLRMAIAVAGLGTWEVDLATGMMTRSTNILGGGAELPDGDIAMEGFIARCVHPEDAPRLREALAAAAAGAANFQLEYRARRSAALPWRWLSTAGGVVAHDPETNAPLRIAGVVRDITEARQADAALAESERRLKAALEAGRVFAFEYDPEADTVLRSDNAAAILGLPTELARRDTGTAFLACLGAEDRARVLGTVAAATPANPAFSIRYRYHRADGSGVVWLQDDGAVRFDEAGRALRVTSLCRDVTAEVEAAEALRIGEARLRDAAESAGFGIYEIDFAGGRAWFDARGAAVVGGTVPAGEWVSLDGPEWAALAASVHPDDREAFAAAWDSVATGGAAGWAVETRLRHPDGSWVWDHCRGTVLERDPITGRPLRLVGIAQDVTERHRLEEELRQGQKLQALGSLAGGIAHDFNNVLQAVSGAAAMIRRDPGRAEAALRGVRLLAEATRRGAAITGRLLTFARRGELCTEPVDPAGLLAAMREMLAPTLGPRIALRMEAPPGLPPLKADRGQLETALVNLATNARDAMPEGGTLTFAVAAERVAPRGPALPAPGLGGPRPPPADLAPGRYLRLSVQDSGSGMDAATLARVTEPFFTTKPIGEGTGLGLPMVKGLAEQSGGAFAIDSVPGEGTVVTLWFPEAVEEVPVPGPRPMPREVAGQCCTPAPPEGAAPCFAMAAGPPTLLVVDDEPMVRETLAEELEAEGYRVVQAPDGAHALARLEAGERVDAMVTDLSMPGLSGAALIAAARARRPNLPVLLLTGHAEGTGGACEAEAASGLYALVRKPTTGAALAARLEGMLARAPGRLAAG